MVTIHPAHIVQVVRVGQLVLGDGEKGPSFPMRFAERRNDKSARVRAAEINAPGRDNFEDLLGKQANVFWITESEELAKPAQFLQRKPNVGRKPAGWVALLRGLVFGDYAVEKI